MTRAIRDSQVARMVDLNRRRLGARFIASRNGNVAMMFGIALVPLLIAAGAAVDLARRGQAQTAIQEAADTALLRAARLRTQDPTLSNAQLTTIGRDLFDAALPPTLAGLHINDFSIVFDGGAEEFRLDIDADLDTRILAAVGVPTLDIGTRSNVDLGPRPYIEVAMALDNTGSMNTNNKIGTLRNAASNLINSLFTEPNGGVLVGLVPFARYVNVGATHAGEPWITGNDPTWAGCVGSRNYPLNISDEINSANPAPALQNVDIIGGPIVCPSPLLPLTDDQQTALDAVAAMTAAGSTYIPAGIEWAWRVLSSAEPFTEGVTNAELEDRAGIKALIVLTDGANTRSPAYPDHSGTNVPFTNTLTNEICENVKADGILVFSIAFDVSNTQTQQMLENCATTPGHYFDAGNASALSAAFEEIGLTLRNLSLSR